MPFPAVRCRPEQTIVKMEMAPDLSLRGRFAPVAISGRHWRFAQATGKMVCTDCVCSGAQRAPCRLAMITAQIQRRKASRFVIARSEATWQSRSIRPDHRALPANTATLRGMASRTPPSTRRVRLPGSRYKSTVPSRDCHGRKAPSQ